ncbi:hypothetical protein DENSPDRAFT_841401 [Dentipellis sp. KUC8613]|nr:hypothetical protein DENSPDRAFT_841401 [Dentipellis sp. KUC8613]
MGNISATTAATVPGGEVSLPDVVLCHTRVINMKKPSDPDALVAWEARLGNKVAHQCFPVIGEIKRAPSRPLRGRKHELQRDRNLFDAVDDLVYYMSVNFNHDPHAKSVIGIVAAGAWWKWRRIKRSEVPPPSFWDEDEPVSAEENRWRNMKYKVSTKYLTAPVNYLGTKQSDQEWDKLRRTALAQILKAHETDYP